MLEPGDKVCFDEKGQFSALRRTKSNNNNALPDLLTHVKDGSNFKFRSPYLSCSLDSIWTLFYSQKQDKSFPADDWHKGQPILRINITKLGELCPDLGDHLIDLSSMTAWKEAKLPTEGQWKYWAIDAGEIALRDISVPVDAIEAMYSPAAPSQEPGESKVKFKTRSELRMRLDSISRYSLDPFKTWLHEFNRPNVIGCQENAQKLMAECERPREEWEQVLRNAGHTPLQSSKTPRQSNQPEARADGRDGRKKRKTHIPAVDSPREALEQETTRCVKRMVDLVNDARKGSSSSVTLLSRILEETGKLERRLKKLPEGRSAAWKDVIRPQFRDFVKETIMRLLPPGDAKNIRAGIVAQFDDYADKKS